MDAPVGERPAALSAADALAIERGGYWNHRAGVRELVGLVSRGYEPLEPGLLIPLRIAEAPGLLPGPRSASKSISQRVGAIEAVKILGAP